MLIYVQYITNILVKTLYFERIFDYLDNVILL